MIKKLRTRFIIIAMLSVVVVLATIVTAINVTNYHSVMENLDQTLTWLSEEGDSINTLQQATLQPNENQPIPHPQQEKDDKKPHPQDKPTLKPEEGKGPKEEPAQKEENGKRDMSAEKPFSTRFFTVLFNQQGEILKTNVSQIAAVSAQTAGQLATETLQQNQTEGFYESYKFQRFETDQGILYIFLECQTEMDAFTSFLWISLAISAGGIAVVFVLVLIFSGIAMKPVAESYEKQKHFITDAGHELKTPLTIIDANCEVLEMERGESPWIDSIHNQVKRLSELTQNLVFLSRMEEEKQVLSLTDFSLTDALLETAQPFTAVATANDKTLTFACQEGVTYHGDEATLRRLISLLLDNALKYSNQGGTISLGLQDLGKRKQITVTNTVEKIGTDSPALWFDRFYRAEGSRNSATGGHGIGLSVAKAIVTAHKGKISAAYKNGNQVVITVLL